MKQQETEKPTKKKNNKTNPFTMVLHKEDKENYQKLATAHGYSLSKFFQEAAKVIMRNPSLLDPTIVPVDTVTNQELKDQILEMKENIYKLSIREISELEKETHKAAAEELLGKFPPEEEGIE